MWRRRSKRGSPGLPKKRYLKPRKKPAKQGLDTAEVLGNALTSVIHSYIFKTRPMKLPYARSIRVVGPGGTTYTFGIKLSKSPSGTKTVELTGRGGRMSVSSDFTVGIRRSGRSSVGSVVLSRSSGVATHGTISDQHYAPLTKFLNDAVRRYMADPLRART